MTDGIDTRVGFWANYAEPARAPFERPPVERYLRVDWDLPDGGCVDVGLEERDGDAAAAATMRMLESCVEVALEEIADAKSIAERIEHAIVLVFPDRYWFAEVWTPGAVDGIKRYQVIQPAVVGGFRR